MAQREVCVLAIGRRERAAGGGRRQAGRPVAVSRPSPTASLGPARGSHGVSGCVQAGSESSPRPRVSPCLSSPPPSRYPNTCKELPVSLPPLPSSPHPFLPTSSQSRFLAQDASFPLPSLKLFSCLPRPNSPSGPPPRTPPPQWVAQNGERAAAQDGGSAPPRSVRGGFLSSGGLLLSSLGGRETP